MTIRTATRKDEWGRQIAYSWDDAGPTPQQIAKMAKAVGGKEDKQASQQAYKAREAQLLSLRQDRLTKEAYESLTPAEQEEYQALYNPVAQIRRLVQQAKDQADAEWMRAENERQWESLQAWRKSQSVNPGSSQTKKIFELSEEGVRLAEARLKARQKRELEAEAEEGERRRITKSLDESEMKILAGLLQEMPSELEQIEDFIAEHRNPIAEIDDPKTLYRLANNPPKRDEPYIPPTSEIANVTSSRTLYKMHQRDANKKR
jgi:hypothetical protein